MIRSLRFRVAAALGAATLILAVGAASYAGLRGYARTTRQVEHTYRVAGELQDVLGTLVDAETGQRGYLLTGDPEYLAPYAGARRRVARDFARLDSLTAEDPPQARRTARLRAMAQRRLDETEALLRLQHEQGAAAATAQVRTDRARLHMESMRALVDSMERHERRRLRARHRAQARDEELTAAILLAGSVLAFALAVGATRSLGRAVEEREQARRALQAQADQLQEQAAVLHEQAAALRAQQEELRRQVAESQALADGLEQSNGELRAANAAVARGRAELEAALAARSRFYAGMSHELRTPINAIIGYTELLLDGIHGELEPGQRQGIERSRRAARHLLELVNDILDLSKIEAGKVEVVPRDVSPVEVVRGLVPTLEPVAAERGSTLVLDVEGCPERVRTDPRRVRQILLNLGSNAIRFGEGRPVHIRCRGREGGGVVLEVEDHGIGIRAADQERIFDEFVQLADPAGGDAGANGTGLGLSVARRLAGLLGGRIELESAPGRGSTFRLVLPAEAPGDGEPQAHDG